MTPLTQRVAAMLLWCLATCFGTALAAPADDAVREATDQVLEAINAQRSSYDSNPGPLHQQLTDILEGYVAFDRIVTGVIGKHKDAVSAEHRARFRTIFVASLVDLYADALIALDAESIDVAQATSRKAGRAQVKMDVKATDGERFDLQYSMGRDPDGRWLVRNMIVGGINLGLTFRNQFDALMSEHDGDVDTVLVEWRETTTEQNSDTSSR